MNVTNGTLTLDGLTDDWDGTLTINGGNLVLDNMVKDTNAVYEQNTGTTTVYGSSFVTLRSLETVNGSVIFTNVKIGKDAQVNDSVVLPGCVIGEGAVLNRVIVGEGVKIAAGAVVGDANSEEIKLVAQNVR